MVVRTVPDSVDEVSGPPEGVEGLEAQLAALRLRFPGAIFHRYLQHVPTVAEGAFIAEGAVLVGDVRIGPDASVWYGCVLRADLAFIQIGARSNVQDGTVIHLGDLDPTVVGEDVVVGHRVVLHGCTVEDACLIGIQATVLDGAVIGRGSVVGAGSVVTASTQVPPGSLVLGIPGKPVKDLGPATADFHRGVAAKYVRLQRNHRLG